MSFPVYLCVYIKYMYACVDPAWVLAKGAFPGEVRLIFFLISRGIQLARH